MKILFVCTGNTCRSPMAEALLRKKAKEEGLELEVDSAGIFAIDGGPISDKSIEVLRRDGIYIEDYKSQMASEELLKKQDLVLTMSRGHKTSLLSSYDFLDKKVYTMKEYAYNIEEDVLDPFGGSLDIYLSTKEELEEIINDIVKKLLKD